MNVLKGDADGCIGCPGLFAFGLAGWLVLLSPAIGAENESVRSFDDRVQPFLVKHCQRCHDGKTQKGEFRIDNVSRDLAELPVAQRWAEVMTRINAREMPPQDEPQPTAAEIEPVVEWIAAGIKAGEAARMARRSRVAHYRLSRDEYAATVYDLLGVHFDPYLPGAFNEDPRWHGFERIGSLLSLSPSHVERYLRAAETVVDRAFPAEEAKSNTIRISALDLRHHGEQKRITDLGVADKVRAAVWPGYELPALRGWWGGSPKQPGLYRCRIQLSGLQPRHGRAPHLTIWNPVLKKTIYDEDILAPEDQPTVVEFETFLTPPLELHLLNNVAGQIPEGHTRNVLYMGGNVFLGSRDHRFVNPTGYKLFDDDGGALHPLLIVDWIEWEGPLLSAADRKKREGLYPATEGDLNEARSCLQRLADRAWRRPATAAEVDRYVKIVSSELAAKESFRSAYLAAATGVLASKNFYYLEEGSASERRDQLNDWELASRLSYFLWGSLPDDELLAVARAGKLTDPAVLEAQLARMLADPKMQRFIEAYPRQWLQLDRVGMFPPDPKLYPDYDGWLEKSMVLETTRFFGEVFTQNLSLREFLSSDWTVVNPRLALHYGLPPLAKSGFQKVSLQPDDHRGGILTHAAVLMLTSDGTRHRPVHRGVWVSEAIFGKTPPPPPPNVEPLAPTPAKSAKATVRQQLEAHATHNTCNACHRNIDPLGFAFDNYDAIGRWRTTEIVSAGQGDNPPVNASGTLADGRPFNGPAEFKQLLVHNVDRFAEAFVENLATFALRRVMTVDDHAKIARITRQCKGTDYRLRDAISQLVLSDLFRQR